MKRMLLSAVALAALMASSAKVSAADSVVNSLPPDVAKAYEGLDPQQPQGASAYKDWHAPKGPPWTIGYASSYAGNSWRAAAMERLQKVIIPQYQKAGLIKDVVITQSDLKDSVQIQQMRQLVDQGVDAIVVCCSNVTALNQTVAYAHSKGVPVFSWSGYITSPYAVSAAANYGEGGYLIAKSLFDRIGGKGDVLLVSGIPGLASSDSFDGGVTRALKESTGIRLAGTVAGKWTDQIAQVEVQKFLATHPGKIDGIIVQSPAETGVLKALLQSGRPVVPITLAGEVGAACYWLKHPDWMKEGFFMWPPGDEFELVFDVMIRTLEGQGPKVQSVARSVLPFDLDVVKAKVADNCSTDSTDWFEPDIDKWWTPTMSAAFFDHPQDPMTWKAK
jgi:ribose transport system substrate-binding protein